MEKYRKYKILLLPASLCESHGSVSTATNVHVHVSHPVYSSADLLHIADRRIKRRRMKAMHTTKREIYM